MTEDIVSLLRRHGYGVVEGAEAVRKKIDEIGRTQTASGDVLPPVAGWVDKR